MNQRPINRCRLLHDPNPKLVPETELEGLIDLVTMKEWVWTGGTILGAGWEQREIRAELKDLADDGVQL